MHSEHSDGMAASRVALILGVSLMALLVRLSPLLRPGADWSRQPDSAVYIQLAHGLVSGCGFARLTNRGCGSAELLRTPGYPLFLALMPTLRDALAAQALMGAAVCLILGVFVYSIAGITAGLVTSLITALDIPTITAQNTIMSDSLFTALVTVALIAQLWAICQGLLNPRAVFAGLLAAGLVGCAIIVRPIGQVLTICAPLPFLVAGGAGRLRRVGFGCIAVAIPLLVSIGWSFRNFENRGVWIVSTIPAYDLYIVRAADVVAYVSGRDFEDVFNEFDQAADHMVEKQTRLGIFDSEAPVSAIQNLRQQGLAIVLSHPWITVFLTVRHLLWEVITPDVIGLSEVMGYPNVRDALQRVGANLGARSVNTKLKALRRAPLIAALVVFQLVFTMFTWTGIALAVRRAIAGSRRDVWLVSIPLLWAFLLLLAAAGPEAYARYRVPALPMLAMVAGFGWGAIMRTSPRLNPDPDNSQCRGDSAAKSY